MGYRKGIRQLRAQIVDDQQVAVKEIGVGLLVILRITLASKSCFRQHIEELKGSQVDDGMAAVHELLGNAVGEKGLAGAHGAQKQKILKLLIKILNEEPGFRHGAAHGIPVIAIIPVIRECVKVFLL